MPAHVAWRSQGLAERHPPLATSSSEHTAVNETLCPGSRSLPKQNPLTLWGDLTRMRESGMRTLIFGVILLAVVAAGSSYTLISSSLAAPRDAKAATFA